MHFTRWVLVGEETLRLSDKMLLVDVLYFITIVNTYVPENNSERRFDLSIITASCILFEY